MATQFLLEPARRIPLAGSADVVVCGGGPAGVAAAVAAARCGVSVILLEASAMPGGIMTSGLMPNVIDTAGKRGFLREMLGWLEHERAEGDRNTFDPEYVKHFMDTALINAGVRVRFNTAVTAVLAEGSRLTAAVTESPAGREAFTGRMFIDCTGNGTLATLAGCAGDCGDPEDHVPQAASLCALCYGAEAEQISDYCRDKSESGKKHLRETLERLGLSPSYRMPTLFRLNRLGYLLMSNHEYNLRPDDADAISSALIHARTEIFNQIRALRSSVPAMNSLFHITASALGLREGRRIAALYNLSRNDLAAGRAQPDAVCTVRFPVDIHRAEGDAPGGYSNGGLVSKPYDIPLRSLIARDKDNLLLGGRCIGGDFYAHASYRVLGNAIPTGEAAGIAAAVATTTGKLPAEVEYAEFLRCGGNPHDRLPPAPQTAN